METKILAIDTKAKVDIEQPREVLCSSCDRVQMMEMPYDIAKFKKHHSVCASSKWSKTRRQPTLLLMGVSKGARPPSPE